MREKKGYMKNSNIEIQEQQLFNTQTEGNEKSKKKNPYHSNHWIKRLFHKEDEEIQKLRAIKKKIRQVQTVEDLENLEIELEELGILDRITIDKLKKKKKKMSDREIFNERIRCNLDTINRVILVGKLYKAKERKKEEQELILNRDERQKVGSIKQKEKDERTRSSGGRSRER